MRKCNERIARRTLGIIYTRRVRHGDAYLNNFVVLLIKPALAVHSDAAGSGAVSSLISWMLLPLSGI